ncbi:MAG: hypothetical protein LBT08_05490 [Synergistaceae bacterium]|jgi:uncharacterized radical SAM superfamily protein|nr:hypothetical protein [Synergistaceae bacterium]
MAVLGMSKGDRMLEYECIELLPDLEEDVFFVDILIPDLEESYVAGLDDWWGDFIAGSNL